MIVEDGTGLVDADSFISVEFATQYLSARGISWGVEEESEKEILCIKASDFINSSFRWNGIKSTSEQALEFPRTGLYDRDGYELTGVPRPIKNATCEAIKVLLENEELFTTESENGAVTSENIKGISFSYDVSKRPEGKSLFNAINTRLEGLFIDKTKQTVISGRVERV